MHNKVLHLLRLTTLFLRRLGVFGGLPKQRMRGHSCQRNKITSVLLV